MDLIKISQQLEKEEITPFDLDLKELEKLSKLLPRDGLVADGHVAEELSGKFIFGCDIIVSLHAIAAIHEGRMVSKRKQSYSEAFFEAENHGHTTAKAREAYALKNDKYVEYEDKANVAKAFRVLMERKYETFLKAHHLMKSVFEVNAKQEPFGNRVVEYGGREENTQETKWKAGEEEW